MRKPLVIGATLAFSLLLALPAPAASEAQAPIIIWEDPDIWVPHHYVGLASWSVTACDPAGALEVLYVESPGYKVGGYTDLPEGTECYTLEDDLMTDGSSPKAATSFRADITARSASGAETVHRGAVRFSMLPADITSLEGFPDLSLHAEPTAWPAYFEMRMKPDGSIRHVKMQWDGATHHDTLTGAERFLEDTTVRVWIATGTDVKAKLMVGSEVMAETYYEPASDKWWDIQPVIKADVNALQHDLKEAVFGPFP